MASLSLVLSVFCFFVALWSFLCSMLCHGSYGATSDFLHYGLWKYCFKYLDSEDWKCDRLGESVGLDLINKLAVVQLDNLIDRVVAEDDKNWYNWYEIVMKSFEKKTEAKNLKNLKLNI